MRYRLHMFPCVPVVERYHTSAVFPLDSVVTLMPSQKRDCRVGVLISVSGLRILV